MEDWKPADPKLLEYDLNESNSRDYSEVFDLDPQVSRGLHEYRNEIVHIFKFDQLLKLKGFSRDVLNQFTAAEPNNKFDGEFQQSLGLKKDVAEPLPSLVKALCDKTQARGCLIATRAGKVLYKYPTDSMILDRAAAKLPDFSRPIQEQLLTSDHGIGDFFVIGFEKQDLILIRAGALVLLALQPATSTTPEHLKLWNTLAREIRTRNPPRLLINNHASVTENDIAFDCPKCVLRIVVDYHAAGYSFPCPRCKANVTVPHNSTSNSSYYEEQKSQAASK